MKNRALQDKRIFFTVFTIVGLVAKIVAEFVHEVCGHGLFVLLFGGEIRSIYISLLWPYELSYINWNFPSGANSAQMAWIYAGGILASLCTSFLVQALLLLKKKILWHSALSLFWLAFWTLINSTGYLLIGGLAPFGDVYKLIRMGVLSRFISLIVGFVIFVIGFISLSWVLRRILSEVFTPKKASLSIPLFWLIIPVLAMVMFVSPERSLQLAYFPLSFIPTLLSFTIEYFSVLPKQRTDASPDYVSEE